MSKGSDRRKPQISKELEDLRWKLAFGKLDDSEKQEIRKEIERLEVENSHVLSNSKS